MKKQPMYLVWILALSLVTFQVAGQNDEQTAEQVAVEMLKVSGAGQLGAQVMEQMFSSFKTSMPDVSTDFWDEIIKEVDPKELENMMIPVYVKHLTKEEMKAAIAFYESPAGRAILAKTPMIMQESMTIGQQWGTEIATKVQKRLEEREQNKAAGEGTSE